MCLRIVCLTLLAVGLLGCSGKDAGSSPESLEEERWPLEVSGSPESALPKPEIAPRR